MPTATPTRLETVDSMRRTFSQQQADLRATARGVTAESVREWLHYNPDTGDLTWKMSLDTRRKVGDVAGYLDRYGVLRIGLRGAIFQCHRIAWLIVHGKWPSGYVDHINGNRGDNRLSNLREASVSQNAQNQRKAHRDSSTGLLGVSHDKRTGKYRASIHVQGVTHSAGCHKSAEEAHAAYLAAKRRLHPFNTL